MTNDPQITYWKNAWPVKLTTRTKSYTMNIKYTLLQLAGWVKTEKETSSDELKWATRK